MFQIFNKILQNLSNTGERPIINQKIEEIPNVSSFAYKFASKFIKNKTILDFGCGGGYGTEYLSRFTNKKVFGFDKDKQTIRIAKKFFNENKKINFCDKIPKKKFDIIVSFQVIEHIKDRSKYYKNLKKILKPNGYILFSTPNKNITSYNLKKPAMVFHEIEFTPKQLKEELLKYFKVVKIFGQMENEMIKKVTKNNYNYIEIARNYPLRLKITYYISQIEIIRIISRHLPMFIKYLLMGFDKTISTKKYSLVQNKKLIDNSFVIIAKVKN